MTRKRIIVEGLDGTGKSALISNIVDVFGHRVQKVPGFHYWQQDHPDGKYIDWYEQTAPLAREEMVPVHDRYLFSEMVYGETLRGQTAMTHSQFLNEVKDLQSYALMIFCTIPWEHMIKNVTELPQMEGVRENIYGLQQAYDKYLGENYMPFVYGGRYVVHNFVRGDSSLTKNLVEWYLNS